jgi:hypothetical protein
MNRPGISTLATVLFLASSNPLQAHHGTAGSYDQKKLVTIRGIVKEFRWRNPHSSLHLVGKDESGNEVTYTFEMGSPSQMVKIGFTRDTMKPGDEVVIQVHPSFTNPASGESLVPRQIVINGKEVKFAANVPVE